MTALPIVQRDGEQSLARLHTETALGREYDLLGVLLGCPKAVEQARAVQPEDFLEGEDGVNGVTFQMIRDGYDRGEEIGWQVMHSRLATRLPGMDLPVSFFFDLHHKAPPLTGLGAAVAEVVAAGAKRRLGRLSSSPATLDQLKQFVDFEKDRIDRAATRGKEIRATPFEWIAPESLPPRQWLYDRHHIRKFISATFATGGSGKTTLLTAEALAMVTGRPLLGVKPAGPLTVWYWNGEDPQDETQKRVMAACRYYGISAGDLGGRLFTDSGRDTGIVIARQAARGIDLCIPCVEQVERQIRERQIDVMIIDPFVASHEVEENSNGAINLVSRTLAAIADRTGCSIEVVHHTRKPSAGQGAATVDDGRGAGALLAAVRSARVLNTMTDAEAADWGIEDRASFFRVDSGKSNLAPRSNKATWRQLVSVDLGNGPEGHSDRVATVTAWMPPDAFHGVKTSHLRSVQEMVEAGEYRSDVQATGWVGEAVADVLGLDLKAKHDKARAKAVVKDWFEAGFLQIQRRKDPDSRKVNVPFAVVGKWVEP